MGIAKYKEAGRRLAGEFGWVVIGFVVAMVGQVLTLKLVTSLLSREQYGLLVVANATSAFLQLLVGAPVQGMGRIAHDTVRSGDTTTLLGATSDAGRPLWVVLWGIVGVLLTYLLPTGHLAAAAVVVGTAFLTYADYRTGRTQGLAQLSRLRALVALHRGLDAVGRAGLVVVALHFFQHPAVALLTFAVASLVVNAKIERIVRRRVKFEDYHSAEPLPTREVARRRIVAFSVPFAFAALLTWATTTADRWFVERFMSLGDAALYAGASQVGMLPFTVLCTVIQTTAYPVLYGRAHNSGSEWRRWITWLSLLYVGLAAVGWVAMFLLRESLVHIVLGRALWPCTYLVPVTSLGWAIFQLSQMLALGPMTSGDTRPLLLPAVAAALASVCCNLVLIPRMGAIGAAVTLGVASSVRVVGMLIANHLAGRKGVSTAPATSSAGT